MASMAGSGQPCQLLWSTNWLVQERSVPMPSVILPAEAGAIPAVRFRFPFDNFLNDELEEDRLETDRGPS